MTKYQKGKERARAIALRYQNAQSIVPMFWGEVLEWQEKFRKLAKKYGLTREFKENGII